uniref:Uncharacterized protein n=1 Tax=Parascaris equorum TaxID=6256 RepID=A0A914S354_PAREQ
MNTYTFAADSDVDVELVPVTLCALIGINTPGFHESGDPLEMTPALHFLLAVSTLNVPEEEPGDDIRPL